MPSISKLDFDLSVDDDTHYTLKGSTLKGIFKSLAADRIVPGPGQTESQTDAGRIILGGTGNQAAALDRPFTVTMSTDEESENLLAISAGRYQEGATGDWTDVEELEATSGSYAYFVIEQDAGRAVTSVALEVEETEQDAVTVTGDPATSFTSRVLLGWVDESTLKQERNGNFLLGLWQIDGEVARWAETTGGKSGS